MIQKDKSATLATNNDQYLFQPIAYGISSYESNSMKSSNPHSGIYEADTSRTLDLNGGNPACNQGGIAVVEPVFNVVLDDQGGQQISVRTDGKCPTLRAEAHGNQPIICSTVHSQCFDARGNGDGMTVPTLTGDHENRVTDYTALVCSSPCYCLQGNGIDRADTAGCNGRGWTEGVSYTLNTIDRPAVVFQTYQERSGPLMANSHPGSYTGQDAFNDMLIAGIDCRNLGGNHHAVAFRLGGFAKYIEGEIGTLRASGGDSGLGSENLICEKNSYYIVRRLTPTECARLQGFPDEWAHPDQKTELTDEEYQFWLNVRNTHAAINGKAVKQYTREQMLRWYNGLHTDSAEYKLWGNGIALPCALYVMEGIAEELEKEGSK